MTLRVAYLVNQYPSVSHTFIRREIQALERQGVVVERISIRGWDSTLVDDADLRERERTRYVLRRGASALASAFFRAAVRSPGKLWSASRLAWRMSRRSDRPFAVHLAYLAEACMIQQWLADSGASHLHAHFATNPAEIAMLVRSLGGPPYSFTAHGSDIMDRPAQIGLSETVSRAAFVIAVCSFGRGQIFKWVTHRDWGRVDVVRCGLEPGYGHGAASPGDGVRRFVCVGRLSKEKGQLLLIEAASQLAAAGVAIDIVLAGDGPMRSDIEALIALRGLSSNVRITGWLSADGVRNELHQARALVLPSLSEGLPVVIMEAMASRLPVIAPYLAGIPELVNHGETGWLFPVSDVAALAAAMRTCLETPAQRLAEIAAAAHRQVWVAHDADIEAGKLAALFARSAEAPITPVS